jgi:hypothetical protein
MCVRDLFLAVSRDHDSWKKQTRVQSLSNFYITGLK